MLEFQNAEIAKHHACVVNKAPASASLTTPTKPNNTLGSQATEAFFMSGPLCAGMLQSGGTNPPTKAGTLHVGPPLLGFPPPGEALSGCQPGPEVLSGSH